MLWLRLVYPGAVMSDECSPLLIRMRQFGCTVEHRRGRSDRSLISERRCNEVQTDGSKLCLGARGLVALFPFLPFSLSGPQLYSRAAASATRRAPTDKLNIETVTVPNCID